MQYRRDAHCLADLGQTFTTVFLGSFWYHETGFSRGHGTTAGGEHQHVVLEQFFDHGDVSAVMHGAGIVAADDTGQASDSAINDIVVEWPVGRPEETAEQVVDGLV